MEEWLQLGDAAAAAAAAHGGNGQAQQQQGYSYLTVPVAELFLARGAQVRRLLSSCSGSGARRAPPPACCACAGSGEEGARAGRARACAAVWVWAGCAQVSHGYAVREASGAVHIKSTLVEQVRVCVCGGGGVEGADLKRER